MEKTKRTIVSVLDAHDIRKKRERLKVATKYFFGGLVSGLMLGAIIMGFM